MAGAAAAGQAMRLAGRRTVVRELGVATVSMLPALLALRGGDLASYHGVEHKAIAGYEQDEDAADAEKEHDRCGSNLVAPMLASAAVGNVAVRRAGLRGPAAEGAVALGSVALAVEVFAWSERHPESRVARLLRRPGREIQRTVVVEEVLVVRGSFDGPCRWRSHKGLCRDCKCPLVPCPVLRAGYNPRCRPANVPLRSL